MTPMEIQYGKTRVIFFRIAKGELPPFAASVTIDVFGELGSAHIESLCKWGPTTFRVRTRVLPSGRPPEESETLVQEDPTWQLEWEHFQRRCREGAKTDLSNDVWISGTLGRLCAEALERFPA